MAKVDYTGAPTDAPQIEAPNDYEHEQASPAAFGAPIAQGAEALGQGIDTAEHFYGQVAADNGTNNTLQTVTNILHGDPSKTVIGPDGKPTPDTGFFGKRGADAMAARQDTAHQIDDAISENRESLSTPQAKLQYDNDTRRYRAQWQLQMGTYADQQQMVWAKDTNNTSALLGLNAASRAPTDDDTIADAQEKVRTAYVKNAQLLGEDPNGAVLKADQDVAMARIRSLVGSPNIADREQAERVLDDSRGVLGSRTDYDQIVRSVKSAVVEAKLSPAIDSAVAEATDHARQIVGNPAAAGSSPTAQAPSPNSIGNLKTSAGFIQPATPTEGVIAAANNLRSGYRGLTLDQIAQKWAPAADGNDPAAWAANVSRAAGIATGAVPNLDDPNTLAAMVRGIGVAEKKPHDLTAFTPEVISNGVAASISGQHAALANGAQSGAVPKYPSTADALNASMPQTLAKAQTDAEQLFPNYPDAQERYVQGVERRLNQTITQQHQQYEVDTHVVQSVLAGPQPPISEEELKASSPQVAAAWQSMQLNNPLGAASVERMFDANAKGRATTYGSGFKDYLDRALAPSTDATRISNESQLWPLVGTGEDAALTNTGVNALSGLLQTRGTSQGEAFAAQAKDFIDQMHADLTFSNPSLGRADPKGEALFSRFMVQALPQLTTANKNGNLSALLNPTSPDYLGKLAQSFSRTPAQIMKDRLLNQSPTGKAMMEVGDTGAMGRYLLKEAVENGRLTKDQAAHIGENHGFFAKAGPAPVKAPAYTPQALTPPAGG